MKVQNYIQGMEIYSTFNDEPKLFAAKKIKKGELLFAETPLTEQTVGNREEITSIGKKYFGEMLMELKNLFIVG